MTEDEIEELRARLSAETERYAAHNGYITDDWVRVTPFGAVALTTEAEILVFNLPRDEVPALQTAYQAYLVLEDLVMPSPYDDRTTALIEKVREIVPPLKSFGRDIPFATGLTDDRFFEWFAATFFDISFRDAHAIYAKHDANLADITIFPDDTAE